jgi:glutathione reductase (NADPH)
VGKTFDLIVLGTGTAGTGVATRCREAGWSVAIVDSRPFGGTCALRGCDPKRVLVGAAEAVDAARRLAGKGVAGDVRVDWAELMRFKRTFTDPVPGKREKAYADSGIASLHGKAKFVDPTAVQVDGERLEARHVHIATGARPANLPIPGADLLTTSDVFLDMDELPGRIAFVGGGYIAFELAHLSRAAGAEVTMVERNASPLPGFDPDLVALLSERTRAAGIDLRLGTGVEAIEKKGAAFVVRTSSESGAVSFDADMVVHSAGRVPDLADLDLEKAGVEHGKRGVVVNDYMQSVSNPAVYAAGDAAASGLPLTPVAGFQARVAAENLIGGNRRKIEYPPVPSVVFSLPPLAAVGMSESEARKSGLDFETRHAKTSGWYSSRRVGEEFSGYKVLVEKGSGRILGAHLFGPGAEELINLFAMAMRGGLTSEDVKGSIFAYPTLGSTMAYMV